MLVYEFKLKGKQYQYNLLDEAIRTGKFIQNACLRLWIDAKPEDKINRFALNKYCKVLADNSNFPWVKKLNSMARQAHAERIWVAISRFYDNCKKQSPGKKGFPKFKKNCRNGFADAARTVEYKTTGYKVSQDRKAIKFTDGFKAGTFKLVGSRDLHFYPLKSIKRVRVVKRADGYYAQFCIDQERL